MPSPAHEPDTGPQRLQKVLASTGIGGRRPAEALIAAGRVTVDGVVATLGTRVDPARALIAVDGRPIRFDTRAGVGAKAVTLAFHKPFGIVVTTSDERGRATVFDVLGQAMPAIPPGLRYVGRLDKDTTGLLLLTTDGELANRLTHPRYHVEKVYEALVEGELAEASLTQLRRGVELEDGMTAPADVARLSTGLIRIAIHEGRTRQVRRMFEAVGHHVRRLRRVAVGPVRLGSLREGEVRPLTEVEERALRHKVRIEGS
jgi:23S rRNA pseudouridine2605 synthase